MADDTLPIIFKSNPRSGLIAIAFAGVAVAAGIARITDHSYSYSGSRIGPFHMFLHTTGWLMVTIGVPVIISALVTIARRCPTLTLDETGILSSRCFSSPVHIPWSAVADVVVKTARIPRRGRTAVVDRSMW